MINLFGEERTPKPKIDKIARNWKNRFQRWSNRMMLSDPTTPLGKCGYGSICDYCEGNDFGRPCVRALNDYLKSEHKTINYETASFEDVWYGRETN